MQIELKPDLSLLAILVIFLANYLVVRRFFLKPVNEVLEWRRNEIHAADRIYEDSLASFEEATAKMESKLHQARKEGSQERERRRVEAVSERTVLIEKTRNEAEVIVSEADASIRADVASAKSQIERDSESLARLAAERILGRRLA